MWNSFIHFACEYCMTTFKKKSESSFEYFYVKERMKKKESCILL